LPLLPLESSKPAPPGWASSSFREKNQLPVFPRVKQLLEVLAFDLGPEEVGKRIRRPLRGIRILPYYGCLVVRPFGLGGKESLENPQAMEKLIEAMGGQPGNILPTAWR
jgi:heterodisulfide reductase subunit B